MIRSRVDKLRVRSAITKDNMHGQDIEERVAETLKIEAIFRFFSANAADLRLHPRSQAPAWECRPRSSASTS